MWIVHVLAIPSTWDEVRIAGRRILVSFLKPLLYGGRTDGRTDRNSFESVSVRPCSRSVSEREPNEHILSIRST